MAIEYILLLGGVIILVAVTSVFMQDVLFKPNKADIENKTQQLQELRNQLNTTQSTRPTPRVLTGTPTPVADFLGSPTPIALTTTPAPVPSATPTPPTPNACTTQNGECRLAGNCQAAWRVTDPDGLAATACGSGLTQTYECCLVGAPTPAPAATPTVTPTPRPTVTPTPIPAFAEPDKIVYLCEFSGFDLLNGNTRNRHVSSSCVAGTTSLGPFAKIYSTSQPGSSLLYLCGFTLQRTKTPCPFPQPAALLGYIPANPLPGFEPVYLCLKAQGTFGTDELFSTYTFSPTCDNYGNRVETTGYFRRV